MSERLRILRELKLYDLAAKELEKCDHTDPSVLFEKMRIFRDTQQFDELEEHLSHPMTDDPRLLSEQVRLLNAKGEQPRLSEFLQEAGALLETPDAAGRPEDLAFLACAAAEALADRGQVRSGLALLKYGPVDSQLRSAAPVFSTQVDLLLKLGWYDAVRRLSNQVELDSDAAEADLERIRRLVVAGRAHGQTGDLESAIRCLDRAQRASADHFLETGVNYPWVWRWRAHTLRTGGRRTEMVERRAELVELWDDAAKQDLWRGDDSPARGLKVAESPTMAIERARAAMWRYDGGEPHQVRDALKRIEAVKVGFTELVNTKAQLLHQLGDHAGLRRLMHEHRNSYAPQLEYTRLFLDSGRHEVAAEMADSVILLRPDSADALLIRVHIEALSRTPDQTGDRAMPEVDLLLARIPEDAPTIALAAERLAQNGHFRESERLFAHLTGNNPANGPGWAGRLQSAVWNRDWALADAIESSFDSAEIPPADRALGAPASVPSNWITLAKALARAARFDLDAADELLEKSGRDLVDQALKDTDEVSPKSWREWRAAAMSRSLGGEFGGPWEWRVESLRWRHRLPEALRLCEEVMERTRNNTTVLGKYGWVLLDCNDPEAAERQFNRALAINPMSDGAWRGRIRALRTQCKHAEAFECAERAQRVLRNDPAVMCEKAWLLASAHRLEAAVEALDEALVYAPNHASALAWRVIFLSNLRDHSRALAESEKACLRRPDSVEVWEARCLALLRRGWDDEAQRAVADARTAMRAGHVTSDGPIDIGVEQFAAGVLAQCGATFSDCEVVIENLRRLGPTQATTRIIAGLYRHHLKLDEARKTIEEFGGWRDDFELLSEHAEVAAVNVPEHGGDEYDSAGLRRGLSERRGFDEADDDLAGARAINPYSPTAIRRQIHLWNSQRRFDDSVRLLERSRRFFDNDFVIDVLLAETRLMCGESADAARICERVAERYEEPGHRAIWLRIVHIRAVRAQGLVRESLAMALDLLGHHPVSRRSRLTLARGLEDLNRTDQALDLLERTLAELPLYPPIGENAALFCRMRGEFERGRAVIAKALRHYNRRDGEPVYERADSGLLAELVLNHAAQGSREGDGRSWKLAEHFALEIIGRPDIHSKCLGQISLGWCRIYQGRPWEAEDSFALALDTGICSTEARFGLAMALLHRADRERDPGSRRELLERALAEARRNIADADFERSLLLAGQAAYQLGDWEQAERHFKESIKCHPIHGGHLELAIVLNHRGRLEGALAVGESALDLRHPDAKLLAVLGYTRIRMATEDKADSATFARGAEEIDRALLMDRTDPTVLSAVVYAATHTTLYHVSTARSLIREALGAKRNRDSVSSTANLQLMLAELTLRHRRFRTNWREWLRPTAKHWAKQVRAVTDDPRARAILESRAHTRAVALAAQRTRTFERRRLESEGQRIRPGWIPQALVIALGIGIGTAGVIAGLFTSGSTFAVSASFLGATLVVVGAVLPKLRSLRIRDVELNLASEMELTGALAIPASLSLRSVIMPQVAAGQSEREWRPEPALKLLGPAVGPMITGHYAYRDAYYPWKTR